MKPRYLCVLFVMLFFLVGRDSVEPLLAQTVETPRAKPVASSAPFNKSGLVCRTKQQDLELRDWIAGIQAQARNAIDQAAAAQQSERELKAKLAAASDDGLQLAKERDKAILDLHHVLKKLHFLKFGITALLTLLIIFVVLKLGIPPPISIYIMAGAAGAGTALVWALL